MCGGMDGTECGMNGMVGGMDGTEGGMNGMVDGRNGMGVVYLVS